ncbi:hypothetical protein M3Y94_01075900 [Aphelenchoides besseyi]|nr:hypothetical protein M3Y94_01075900 [Aphelenchoides besseyi]KAI6218746.1 hypothetical protein M3Y95_01148700 [Aphelenchoides besseyi]
MIEITDSTIFWMIGIVGSSLGVFLNVWLLLVLAKKRKYPCSFLFACTASFDLLFSITEVFTQHQIAIKNGVMFVLAHGIEWAIRPYYVAMLSVFILHCFVCMHALFILPALYHYHYLFVKNQCRTPSKLILIKNLAITTTVGLLVAVPAAIGVDEAIERGRRHYLAMFDDEWFQANAKNFLYASDIRDVGTMFFFGLDLTFTTLSIAFTSYYAFRARLLTIENEDEWMNDPSKIPFIRSQFTRALMYRTINTWILALLPLALVVTAIIFRLDIEILGNGIIAPWSSLGLFNAATTLFVLYKS